MTERAIDKMIKELEAELASHEDRYGRELTRHHIERARRLAALEKEREGEVVLYSGLCKVGEADFEVRKGRGDEDSVVLVPVPYKLIKGKRMEIVARPTKAEKGGE